MSVRDLCTAVAPRLSPDGSKLAVRRSDELFVIDPSRGVISKLATTDGPNVSWSGDSSRIAFSAGRAIKVIPVDGSGATTLTETGRACSVIDWTPDGRAVLY